MFARLWRRRYSAMEVLNVQQALENDGAIVFDVYNAEGKMLNESGLTQEEATNFVLQLQESKVDAKFSIRSRPAK